MGYLFYLGIFFLLFTLVASRDRVLSLAVLAAFLPAYVIRFSFGPLPMTALEGMVLIQLGFWVYDHGRDRAAWKKTLSSARRSIFFTPGILLLAAALIACFVSPDLRAGLGIWRAYFVEPVLLYVVALTTLQTEKDWRNVFRGFGCAVLGLTALAIFQYVTGTHLPTWEWTVWATRRATGVYTSPNALGLFVVPVGVLFLTRLTALRRADFAQWRRWAFDACVVGASILSLILAWSKGAMVAFVVAIGCLAWRTYGWKKITVAAALVILLTLLFPTTRYAVLDIASFRSASGESRLALYQGSLALLHRHPILGTGLSGFAAAFESVRPEGFTEKLIYPHDIFLNFWLETTLLGLIALLWMIGRAVRVVWLHRQHPLVLALGLALLTMIVHGLVDVPYFKNDLAMLTWLLLAALSWQTQPKTA